MSRTVIAAVVAAVIAVLAAIAFFVTTHKYDDKLHADAKSELGRAAGVVQQLAQLEAIDIANKAEWLASDRSFVAALQAPTEHDRGDLAARGFARFADAAGRSAPGDKAAAPEPTPDIMALVDGSGDLVAMDGVDHVVPNQWKTPDQQKTLIPALDLALHQRVIISDIWNSPDNRMMKIGVAPVVDPDGSGDAIIGAVVLAYAQTAQQAQQDKQLLGPEIAYYDGTRVATTSFTNPGTTTEDTGKSKQLTEAMKSLHPGKPGEQTLALDGVQYLVSVEPLARSSTKHLPADYPQLSAAALLLSPVADAQGTASWIKLFLLLLGFGALGISLVGLYLSHRRIMAQVDQIELGVTDIINGNVDRTFRPVGVELDGLANGLNVMLARLLGRPEPGDEEFDDDGNPVVPGRVEFEDSEAAPAPQTDPQLAALAQEAEPDYYKRVFTEYVAARKAVGSPDDVSFENFIAKLKVNEGKLKAQYQCRAVRFRVVTKDNKVSLKPVPIFA